MNAATTHPPASAGQTYAPTPIRAILFDKDGTLFDFRETWLAAYRGATAEVAGLGPSFVDVLLAPTATIRRRIPSQRRGPLPWATTAIKWPARPPRGLLSPC